MCRIMQIHPGSGFIWRKSCLGIPNEYHEGPSVLTMLNIGSEHLVEEKELSDHEQQPSVTKI